jgi:hypothetical protein
MEAENDAMEADSASEPEPDWIVELSMATERVMVVAETLKEDRLLMQGARRLLADMDEIPSCFTRRIFEAVASCLVLEAAEQQRKARPRSRRAV